MKTKYLFREVVTVLCAIGCLDCRGQGSIIRHVGNANPTTKGWGVYGSLAVTAGPITNDLGRDAWAITTDGNPVYYHYLFDATQRSMITNADWSLGATLRIIESPVFMWFDTGNTEFRLRFGTDANGDPIVYSNSSLSPAYFLGGGGGIYHDYQLAYQVSLGLASLWVDGTEVVSDIAGVSNFGSTYVAWGGLQGPPSQANWSLIDFKGAPEPSPLVLFGCGVALLLAARARCYSRLRESYLARRVPHHPC